MFSCYVFYHWKLLTCGNYNQHLKALIRSEVHASKHLVDRREAIFTVNIGTVQGQSRLPPVMAIILIYYLQDCIILEMYVWANL